MDKLAGVRFQVNVLADLICSFQPKYNKPDEYVSTAVTSHTFMINTTPIFDFQREDDVYRTYLFIYISDRN